LAEVAGLTSAFQQPGKSAEQPRGHRHRLTAQLVHISAQQPQFISLCLALLALFLLNLKHCPSELSHSRIDAAHLGVHLVWCVAARDGEVLTLLRLDMEVQGSPESVRADGHIPVQGATGLPGGPSRVMSSGKVLTS